MTKIQRLLKLQEQRNKALDDDLQGLSKRLNKILADASTEVASRVTADLVFDATGRLINSAENLRTLTRLPEFWQRAIQDSGYRFLEQSYRDAFAGQMPWFEQSLELLEIPKPPFAEIDTAALAQRVTAQSSVLQNTIAQAGVAMQRTALLNVAAITRRDLAALLAKQRGITAANAESVADTALSTHYRTISDRGYSIIQAAQKTPLRYRYAGPSDLLTREFCAKLLRGKTLSEQSWTRSQIDAMDNGQTGSTFVTCGGYRCRHLFLVLE
jgi:hypothetical protein